jgi:O-antigen ligase
MLSLKPRPARVAGRTATLGTPVAGTPVVAAPVLDTSIALTAPNTAPRVDPAEHHPFRKIVLFFGLAALFARFGLISDIIAYTTGANSYLLYVTALPAVAAMILSGGVKRTFQGRAPYWWMLFFGWMILATPFSFWPGGSTHLLENYVRTDLPFLLIAGSLALNWGDIRATFYTIAAAAVVNLATAQIFMDTRNGRIELAGLSTIGNSNDLAAHLLLVLPFLLFVVMDAKRSLIIRVPLLAGVLYGVRVILGTASRGALLALFAVFIFVLWRASPVQRAAGVVAAAIIVVLAVFALPTLTLTRLGSLFGAEHLEAEESEASRLYLFQQSVVFTFEHPIVGVGPDQFANFEGKTRLDEGKRGNWHDTHCDFTQVSAECGIPALIFFVGGIASAILVVLRVHRKARRQKNLEITNACFCYLAAMIGFLIAITFLPLAYHYYLPAMIGLAGSIHLAASRVLDPARPAPAVARG